MEELDNILQKLHNIQILFYKYIDISIETRKDHNGIRVHLCAYTLDDNNNFKDTSKLYTYIFQKDSINNQLEYDNFIKQVCVLTNMFNNDYFKLKKEDI